MGEMEMVSARLDAQREDGVAFRFPADYRAGFGR
jgi:hypothetical protein